MASATADIARELTTYWRINRDGSIVFNFTQSDGTTAFDLTGYTIVVNFKLKKFDTANVLQLTSGLGITISSNVVTVAITKAQANTFREQTYYWEMVRTKSGLEKNWFTGDAIFHNGKFDGI